MESFKFFNNSIISSSDWSYLNLIRVTLSLCNSQKSFNILSLLCCFSKSSFDLWKNGMYSKCCIPSYSIKYCLLSCFTKKSIITLLEFLAISETVKWYCGLNLILFSNHFPEYFHLLSNCQYVHRLYPVLLHQFGLPIGQLMEFCWW